MKLLQSIRFRTVIGCIFFSIVVTLCYGWVTFYGVKYNSDEIFNWYIAQESGQLLRAYYQDPTFEFPSETTANIVVTRERDALAIVAKYYVQDETKAKFTQVLSFEQVKLPGPRFTTEQGFIIYEFSADNKTVHILKSALENQKDKAFYYIVDVSEFINYDNQSEQYIAELFIKILVVIMVLALVIGFALATMVVSPLTRLASSVDKLDHQNYAKVNERYFDDEIGFLATKLNSFIERTNAFVEREKAFSRDVSHELRTPVASSRAAIELALSTEEGQAEPMNRFLQRIVRANKDMTHLIETFLLLGRENKENLTLQSFNLHQLINESFNKHDYLKRNQAVSCINQIATDVMITAAKQHLAIVIDNIIRNALQHTHEGTVSVAFEQGSILIQDTGDGMANQNKPSMNSNVLDKSGVGLNIVKRLSELQGWHVKVQGTPGEGTIVSIVLVK